jgi:hypothetical protein
MLSEFSYSHKKEILIMEITATERLRMLMLILHVGGRVSDAQLAQAEREAAQDCGTLAD